MNPVGETQIIVLVPNKKVSYPLGAGAHHHRILGWGWGHPHSHYDGHCDLADLAAGLSGIFIGYIWDISRLLAG